MPPLRWVRKHWVLNKLLPERVITLISNFHSWIRWCYAVQLCISGMYSPSPSQNCYSSLFLCINHISIQVSSLQEALAWCGPQLPTYPSNQALEVCIQQQSNLSTLTGNNHLPLQLGRRKDYANHLIQLTMGQNVTVTIYLRKESEKREFGGDHFGCHGGRSLFPVSCIWVSLDFMGILNTIILQVFLQKLKLHLSEYIRPLKSVLQVIDILLNFSIFLFFTISF